MDNRINFEGIEEPFLLIGVLNAYMNRLQAAGDTFFQEISWKQFFVLIGMKVCETPPTIKELAEVLGTSHQNVKQLLLKLERIGYVRVVQDEQDKRKQRIYFTEQYKKFDEKYEAGSKEFIKQLYQGVEKEKLAATIQTIMQLDQNLKGMESK